MGAAQVFKDLYLWYRHHDGAKEFTVYMAFVVIFSIVTFASKPGVEQYWTNEYHTAIFATADNENFQEDFAEVESVDDMYSYLKDYLVGEVLYPDGRSEDVDTDEDNWWGSEQFMNKVERQFISGYGRVMGAHRLRQVRSKPGECDIPDFLKDMYGDVVGCESNYGLRSRSKAEYSVDKELGNFTLPYTWRSAGELNSSVVYAEYGRFDTYTQDGFSIDFLPNVSPNIIAQYMEDCQPVLKRSLDKCIVDQQLDLTPPSAPPPPPLPLYNPPGPAEFAGLALADFSDPAGTLREIIEYNITLSPTAVEQSITFNVINTGDATLEWEYDGDSLRPGGATPDYFPLPILLAGTVDQQGEQAVELKFVLPDAPGSSYDTLVQSGATGVQPADPPFININLISEPDLDAFVKVNVFYDLGAAAAPSGRRLQQGSTACQIIRDDPVVAPVGLDMARCTLEADDYMATPPQICHETIRAMGFQLLFKYSDIDRCGGCCNAADDDKLCNAKCYPGDITSEMMDILIENSWVDNGTRAVVMDTTLFNPNSNLFTTIRNMFELPNSGGVWPTGVIRTFKVYRYVTYADTIIMGLELVFCAMIVWYTIEELVEINRQRWAYFKEAWNYLDWANLMIFYTVIGLRIASVLRIQGFDFESVTIDYVDFPVLGVFASQELNISSLNFFLMYFKIFKYLSAVPRMDSILVTVSAASFDLALFMVMAVCITFGFAAAFYVCFGATLFNYKTIGDCFGALTRALLGDFDYQELSDANRVMAPVLFYAYFVMVFFVLLNMFLAIINDSYAEVKGNQSESDLLFYSNLRAKLKEKVSMLFSRKQNIHNLAQELMVSDSNMDDMIDESELQSALKDNPRAYEILQTTGAKDLLAKYDVSGDGVLDKAEMTAILRELAEKEASVQKEMDDETGKGKGIMRGSGGGGAGGQMMVAGNVKVDLAEVEARIDKVEGQIKEMSRNVAKKLSLMIDLMMSLSDQISNVNTMPVAPSGGAAGNQIVPR
eukprot:CAMPEP_0182913856 /NCGR_PEP_ID=MMETSP0034_2-20130328/38248_1 /TAXON_ID=156128 /ORGANISM="Nephroselmis pyriformis, Strain CCMP717" /LENGTH=1001 /DNA_ID=CAMNT_0025050585 /DNA_START=146 /DNA_END=3151 /DNA_ORIENTATION=+